MKNISLVILTCNQRELTLRCLASLRDFLVEPVCELILVDNGSTDGTAEAVAKAFPAVRIVRLASNMGVAAGRNAGLREATGKHLMILDNDTLAAADTIFGLSAYLTRHPEVGLVAPRLISPDGEVQTSFKGYPGLGTKLRNVLGRRRDVAPEADRPDTPFEPFYLIGAAQMFPREVYERAGGLDEHIFFGPEDADFCMAVRRQGLKVVYYPRLTIVHDWQRATSRRLFSAAARRHAAGLFYFYRKHKRWF
ncbi:MAG: glycosyltransferase family 2 protein [Muribaculaceae bacterium]|nr:glycosyltransferase family 2 protein [Muribaculaceae bacterium]